MKRKEGSCRDKGANGFRESSCEYQRPRLLSIVEAESRAEALVDHARRLCELRAFYKNLAFPTNKGALPSRSNVVIPMLYPTNISQLRLSPCRVVDNLP